MNRMQPEGFLGMFNTSTGVQLKTRVVSYWTKPQESCCSFSAKSGAINNGTCSAGSVNKKGWTLLCQLLLSLSMVPTTKELMILLGGAETEE